MAVTLSITVTDAQGARAQTAFGSWVFNSDGTRTWTPATAAQMRQFIKDFVQAKVIGYEAQLAADADRANRQAETW